MPVLRRADAHPDAPARKPIFASSDFAGNDIFATKPVPSAVPVVEEAPEPVFDFASLSMPRSPEPLDEEDVIAVAPLPLDEMSGDTIMTGFAPLAAPVPPAGMEAMPDMPHKEPRPPMDGLTIAELAERFERGLLRRSASITAPPSVMPMPVTEPRVLADIPAAPPVANRADVEADIDQALRDALGTLQKMSAR